MNLPKVSKVAWEGGISCEGGPVIVANLADFIAWLDAGAARALAHAYEGRASASQKAQSAQGLRYRITGGPIVAAWSPNGVQDLDKPIEPAGAAHEAADRVLDFATAGSGALVRLEPGRYTSSLYYHEDAHEQWGVAWCVLRRTSPP
jgi:hypothetical protein